MAGSEELTEGLRRLMRFLNAETRLATPTRLERCMVNVLDGPGVDWLLEAAQAWGLADAGEVRGNVGAWEALLETETGRQAIMEELRSKRGEIQAWRRKMVSHARVWGPEKPGMEFRTEALPDSGDIYALLTREPAAGGGG